MTSLPEPYHAVTSYVSGLSPICPQCLPLMRLPEALVVEGVPVERPVDEHLVALEDDGVEAGEAGRVVAVPRQLTVGVQAVVRQGRRAHPGQGVLVLDLPLVKPGMDHECISSGASLA